MGSPLWALVVSERGVERHQGAAAGPSKTSWSPGVPSTLPETLQRVTGLVPASHTVAVVSASDRAEFSAMQAAGGPGHVVREPNDRGSAPSVLMGLTTILEIRPDAHVLVTRADHRLRDLDQFRFSVRQTVGWIREGHAEIVLFGARPVRPAGTASWITPGPSNRRNGPRPLRPITSFVDQAECGDVAELTRSGSVGNTNVLVARAEALFDLYRQHMPDLVDIVVRAKQLKGLEREALLTEEYRALRTTEVSRDVLSHARDLAVYVWPASIGWARTSATDRLDMWQQQLGRRRLAPVLGWAPVSVRRALGA